MQSRLNTSRKEMSQGLMALLFSAPAVLIIAATILAPFLIAVFLSLHNWNLKRPGRERFIGLENYTDWLTDSDFWEPLQTTFTFALMAVVLIVIISLLISLLLNEKFPGRGILRALLLVPWAIPSVVNALLWKWLLNPQYGLLNAVFFELGIITEYQNVLGSMPSVMIWLVIAYSWIHIRWRPCSCSPACRLFRVISTNPPSSTALASGSGSFTSRCPCCARCFPSSSSSK